MLTSIKLALLWCANVLCYFLDVKISGLSLIQPRYACVVHEASTSCLQATLSWANLPTLSQEITSFL